MRAARHIDIAHGLYPRDPLPAPLLDALSAWLQGAIRRSSGRTYAGGLTKFDPGEIERLPVPPLEELRDSNPTGYRLSPRFHQRHERGTREDQRKTTQGSLYSQPGRCEFPLS